MEASLIGAIISLSIFAFLIILRFLLSRRDNPGCVYDAKYDAIICRLLDRGAIKRTGRHTAQAGNLTIWIANYPYAFGHPYGCRHDESLMPSLKTKRRLFDEMRRQSIEAIENDSKEAGQ